MAGAGKSRAKTEPGHVHAPGHQLEVRHVSGRERRICMPPTKKSTLPPALRLINNDDQAPDCLLSELTTGVERQSQLLRRPGDHLELFTFSENVNLAPIRAAARQRGLWSETALVLVIERALVIRELHNAELPDLVSRLDHLAEAASPGMELWSPHASYLRHLVGLAQSTRDERPLGSPRVALPLRLVDQLNDGELPVGEEAEEELELAIAWEIAALVAGKTIAEWSYSEALTKPRS